MKKRNSIVTDNLDKCFVCQSERNIEIHHCIHGTANRKISDKYDLIVGLCNSCHRELHEKNRQLDLYVIREAQFAFERKYGREKFMKVFMKNWL